jgi:hypothetical protein
VSEHEWGSQPDGGYVHLTHLHATITALHQSIEPAAIRSNILEVLIAVHHALYGDAWGYELGQEYQAWEEVYPDEKMAEWYLTARDTVGAAAAELADGAAQWLSEPDWHDSRDTAVSRLVWYSASVRDAKQ